MATSAGADSEAWLQDQLLAMRDSLPFLDADMVSGLVSYCPQASDADVAEYLSNIVGESDQSMAVVSGYLERRRQKQQQGGSASHSARNPPQNAASGRQQQVQDSAYSGYGDGNPSIQVYVKPRFDEASGSVPSSSRRSGAGGGAGGADSSAGFAAAGGAGGVGGGGAAGATRGGNAGGNAGGGAGGGKHGGRKRRGGVAVGLADLEQVRVFKQGAPCDCQAAVHHLVNNCLGCGKIVCEQEGEGPCKFCGVLVLRGSDSMGVMFPGVEMEGNEWEDDYIGATGGGGGGAGAGGMAAAAAGGGGAVGGTGGLTEAEAKAFAFRDRLVEYNRTSAQRTVVIDDQSDYFKSNGVDGDGDAWLTEEEREVLRKREEEREREEEERRRRVVVTLDLIGRRVLVADGYGADVAGGAADVAQSQGANSGQEAAGQVSEKQTKAASGGVKGGGGGGTGVGSIFLMRGQGGGKKGMGDKGGKDFQNTTLKQEVVSGINVLIKGEEKGEGLVGAENAGGGSAGAAARAGSGRTRLMPSPNLPIAAPVFVKPNSGDNNINSGISGNAANNSQKKGGKGKKGEEASSQKSAYKEGAYKEAMARLQHDSPLLEAMRELQEEVGGRGREGGREGGSGGAGGVGGRGGVMGGRGAVGGRGRAGRADGGGRGKTGVGAGVNSRQLSLDPRDHRDVDGPCGAPAELAGLADLADEEADVDGRFDICLPSGRFNLAGGKGGGGGMGGARLGGGEGGVLQEGLVLLKGWLTREQQIEIVRECRRLGLGPGGFYRPKFLNGGQMKLHMMCLGQQHWEPNLRAYQPRRTFVDDAEPPPLPASFISLTTQAVSAAQTAARAASGSSNKNTLPDMKPSVCIANFYTARRGSLGMHQDKDEPPASIRRGAPVVSFSLGDSADFLHGWQRDPERAAKVVLESGDAVVFGGASRLMFHGVPCVHGGTAPDWLVEATGMRPGRLNLTFREL